MNMTSWTRRNDPPLLVASYGPARDQTTFVAGESATHRLGAAAFTAGVVGMASSLTLTAFFVLFAADVAVNDAVGTASDLLGALSFATMVPVVLALGARLPPRPTTNVVQSAGLCALIAGTVLPPLMVVGALSYDVETPIMMAANLILAGWFLLGNYWLRPMVSWPRIARLGELCGGGVLVGAGLLGLGLLSSGSLLQLVVFGIAAAIGIPAYLAIPVWFLLLGRHLLIRRQS